MLDKEVSDSEYLYRGVPELQWNHENDRPSSAAFKDSWGTSVDRDGGRTNQECIERLLTEPKEFHYICRISARQVREFNAHIHYNGHEENQPNDYHSEIHDSPDRVQVRTSKAKKISKNTEKVYSHSG